MSPGAGGIARAMGMTTAADSPVPTPPAAPRRRRRWPALLLLAGVALVGGLLGWYGWRRYAAPLPPDVPLAGADPALARAVEGLRQEVRRQPDSAAAWGRLGRLLYTSDYTDAAAACFAQAGRLDAADPRWPYLRAKCLVPRDPDAALPHLRRAVALCDGSDPANVAPRLELAEVLLAKGRCGEAEAELGRAAAAAPDDAGVCLDRGLVACARGDPEAGRAYLLRCRASPFTRKRACSQLAAVAQRLGDPAAADRFARQAAALPPDLPRPDPYVEECTELAVGRPLDLRGAAELEAQGRYRDAVAKLQALLAEQPDYRSCIQLSENLAHLGAYREAERALRTAVEIEPKKAAAYYYLGKLEWMQGEARRQEGDEAPGRFTAGADFARKALARRPDYGMAHMVLGLCLRRLGDRPEALRELRRAAACDPEAADAHLHLGEVLAENGKPEEARRELEQAAQLAGPEDPRPRQELERLPAAR